MVSDLQWTVLRQQRREPGAAVEQSNAIVSWRLFFRGRKFQLATQPIREPGGAAWAEPAEDRQQTSQQWVIVFQPPKQVTPVHLIFHRVEQVEYIGPITMIALHDVEFAPHEFLFRDHTQSFAAD